MKVLSKTQFTASEIKLIHYTLHSAIEIEKEKLESFKTVPDFRCTKGTLNYKMDPAHKQTYERYKRNINRMKQLIRKIEYNMKG